jgi:hypothetical protein
MEFKGSKGKWEVESNDDYFTIKTKDDVICSSIIMDDEDEPIYNALLISKAPEMLEILKSLENDDNSIPIGLWNKIQILIKEATEL